MAREKPTKAQRRRAAKDRVIEATRDLVRTGVSGSAPKPGPSGRTTAVDAVKLDRVRETLQELDR